MDFVFAIKRDVRNDSIQRDSSTPLRFAHNDRARAGKWAAYKFSTRHNVTCNAARQNISL